MKQMNNRMIRLKSQRLLCALLFGNSVLAQMAYVGVNSNQLAVVDLSAETVQTTIQLSSEAGIGVFKSDFSAYYLPNWDLNAVLKIDPQTHTITDTIFAGSRPLHIVLNQDETKAYVCNQTENTISVIDLTMDIVVNTIPTGTYPTRMAISPDGTEMLVTNGLDFSISRISLVTETVIEEFPVNGCPVDITYSQNGLKAYSTLQCYEGEVALINPSPGAVIDSIQVGYQPHDMRVDHSGSWLIVTNQDEDYISKIDLANNQVVDSIPVGNRPTTLGFGLPGDDLCYVVNNLSGTISKVDVSNGTVLSEFYVGISPFGIAFFPKVSSVQPITNTNIKVYPTAVDDVLNVVINSDGSQSNKLFVVDIQGNVVLERDLAPFSEKICMPVGHLLPGVYTVSINGLHENVKFIRI